MAASSGVATTLAGKGMFGPFLRRSSSTMLFSAPSSSGGFYRVGPRVPGREVALRMSSRSEAPVDLEEKPSAAASTSALEQFKISADRTPHFSNSFCFVVSIIFFPVRNLWINSSDEEISVEASVFLTTFVTKKNSFPILSRLNIILLDVLKRYRLSIFGMESSLFGFVR